MSDARIKLSDSLLRLAYEAWSVRQRATGDVTDAISALIDERIDDRVASTANRCDEDGVLWETRYEQEKKRSERFENRAFNTNTSLDAAKERIAELESSYEQERARVIELEGERRELRAALEAIRDAVKGEAK